MFCAFFLSYVPKDSLILNVFFPHLPVLCMLVTFWSRALGQGISHPLTLAEFGEIQSPGYGPSVCREAAGDGGYNWSIIDPNGHFVFSPIWIQKCNQTVSSVPAHDWPVVKVRRCIWLKASSTLRLTGHKNAAALLSVGCNVVWDNLDNLLVCFQPVWTAVCTVSCTVGLHCNGALPDALHCAPRSRSQK